MTVPFDPFNAPPGAFAVPGVRCIKCMYYSENNLCMRQDAPCLPGDRADRTHAIFRPISEKEQPVTVPFDQDFATPGPVTDTPHKPLPIDGAVDLTAKKREALRLIATALGFRVQQVHFAEGGRLIEREGIVL